MLGNILKTCDFSAKKKDKKGRSRNLQWLISPQPQYRRVCEKRPTPRLKMIWFWRDKLMFGSQIPQKSLLLLSQTNSLRKLSQSNNNSWIRYIMRLLPIRRTMPSRKIDDRHCLAWCCRANSFDWKLTRRLKLSHRIEMFDFSCGTAPCKYLPSGEWHFNRKDSIAIANIRNKQYEISDIQRRAMNSSGTFARNITNIWVKGKRTNNSMNKICFSIIRIGQTDRSNRHVNEQFSRQLHMRRRLPLFHVTQTMNFSATVIKSCRL